MLLNIHNVQGGPTRIIWLKMSTVPRLKKKKKKKNLLYNLFSEIHYLMVWDSQGDLQSIAWQHIYRQCREISLEISPSFPQAPEGSVVYHSNLPWPCVYHSTYIAPLPRHLRDLSFRMGSVHALHCCNDCTPSLPKAPVCLLMVFKIQCNWAELPFSPPLLLLASPFNSLSDSVPPLISPTH